MPQFATNLAIDYFGVIFILFGLFLVLTGAGVIKIEQVTVMPGKRTLGLGMAFLGVGIVVLMLRASGPGPVPVTPTPPAQPIPPSSSPAPTGGSTMTPLSTPSFRTFLSSTSVYHLGDEQLDGWPPPIGTCVDFSFVVPGLTRELAIDIRTYGADISPVVFLNDQRILLLPAQKPKPGEVHPNEWTEPYTAPVPLVNPIDGMNRLSICVEMLEANKDHDDFQIQLLRIAGR